MEPQPIEQSPPTETSSGKAADPNSYRAESIQVLEGLEAVRKRPGMYVGTTSLRGATHLIWEAVDNAIDEALAGHCTQVSVILHKDGFVSVVDNGRGIPVDLYPQLKMSALEVVMVKLHAGGKFDKKSYKVSGGLHGVGISVTCALSTRLDVTVKRDGKIYTMAFEKGKKVQELKVIGETTERGTTVRFLPDNTIFEDINFDQITVANRLRELAFLNKGVKILFFDERTDHSEVFHYQGGLLEFVSYLNRNAKPLHAPIFVTREKEDYALEVAFQYNDSYTPKVMTFANNINTHEGGTHLTGFKSALTRCLNKFAEKYAEKEEKISSDDTLEGLAAIISIKLSDPQFEGQTKTKLGNSEVKGIVDSLVSQALSDYFEEHPKDVKLIVQKCLAALKAREAARNAAELIRRKSVLGYNGSLPGKLSDCSSRDPKECEVYLVEGDSAGGCFSGDTRVTLVDGRNLTFLELIEEHYQGRTNYCYTLDEQGSVRIAPILHPRPTKKKAKVIKMVLDNQESIICTPDHLFRLLDGTYLEARALTPQTKLATLGVIALVGGGSEHILESSFTVNNVSEYSQPMDVYDLEVADTHNFALASGVFVHNSAKQGRDRRTQAILPLRGKILNVEKSRLHKVLANNEITNIISALGCGIGEDFHKEKLRYHKVIIMTDADVDGNHISCLLLTFFYRHMPQLIEAGHVFLAQPPLFKIQKNKTIKYAYKEEDKDAIVKEMGGEKGIVLQRYKGLGEMQAQQLWDTTMDPTTRTLKRITIEDAVLADQLFSILMGDEVDSRRDFIMQNAKFVKELDI